MNLIEIAHPERALSAADREMLATGIVHQIVGDGVPGDPPEATMRRARRMTHVAFRPLLRWTTGDGPWQKDQPPPLWITLTTPEAWREEIAATMIGLVRNIVRRLDDEHGWQRAGGDVWITVHGVPDGSIGLDGRAAGADDVVAHLTEEFRMEHADEAVDLPDGVAIDPMCGMQVRLGKGAITLDHDGKTLGFCAAACRATYARQHGLEVE